MFWEDNEGQRNKAETDDVVDLVFRIRCPTIPADHAHALGAALTGLLPWLRDDARAGVHTIHGAPTGNGWIRPDDEAADAVLHLSKRARLQLRVPATRLDAARTLEGQTLDIDGHAIEVGTPSIKELDPLPTLFARYVVGSEEMEHGDEMAFLSWVKSRLAESDIRVRKLMCGRSHTLKTPDGGLFVRSVMVADLDKDASLKLQRHGIGPLRHMGCGLFIPHKGIVSMSQGSDKES
ncbi:MAG: type I-MYXAN CRISPR-associated protein Cas6/Cmx6 [Gammaproteobacteria bacterium]|nr:type I-MYXAN CRISPR-associated protein Cas6/Cmx6 [Gammaproteobacteria bacterium]